MDEVIVMF